MIQATITSHVQLSLSIQQLHDWYGTIKVCHPEQSSKRFPPILNLNRVLVQINGTEFRQRYILNIQSKLNSSCTIIQQTNRVTSKARPKNIHYIHS